jgi:rhodanese-related sulfurtransferase
MMSADELERLIQKGSALMIVDVRSLVERSDGFLIGSTHVAYSEDENTCAQQILANAGSEVCDIVVHCMYSKERARRIAQTLSMHLKQRPELQIGAHLLENGFQSIVNSHPHLVSGFESSQWVQHGRQGLVWKPDMVFEFAGPGLGGGSSGEAGDANQRPLVQ